MWLCPQMNAALLQDPIRTRMCLTHEILHTQGLEEAPHYEGAPEPWEINTAIGELCDLN